MNDAFFLKGNICHTPLKDSLDVHEGAYLLCEDGRCGGIFDAPTIIGVGERRPEFVGALDDLREIVREESGPTINYGGVSIVISGRGKDAAQLAAELQDELERRTSPWKT